MRILCISWIIVGLITTQPLISMAAKTKTPPKSRTLVNLSLKEAGLEFQKIRNVKGHFSGGEWSDQVDRWMGRKHQLMLHLQHALTSDRAEKDTITGIMGKPDYSFHNNDPDAPEFYSSTLARELKHVGDEVLIYTWRGSHDYLYFIFRNKQLLKSDWWMAFE